MSVGQLEWGFGSGGPIESVPRCVLARPNLGASLRVRTLIWKKIVPPCPVPSEIRDGIQEPGLFC